MKYIISKNTDNVYNYILVCNFVQKRQTLLKFRQERSKHKFFCDFLNINWKIN